MRRQELRQQEEPTAAKVERTMAKVEMTATQVPWSHLEVELLKLWSVQAEGVERGTRVGTRVVVEE